MKKLSTILLLGSLTLIFFVFNGEVPVQEQVVKSTINQTGTGGDDPTKDPNYETYKKNFWNQYQTYIHDKQMGKVTPVPVDPNRIFEVNNLGKMDLIINHKKADNIIPPGPSPNNVSTYTWAQSSTTFTPIVGGTVLYTSTWDDGSNLTLPIGFTFTFDNVSYTTFNLNTNGYINFGASITQSYCVIQSGLNTGLIAGLGADLVGSTASSEIRYQTIGSSPNQQLVVQWLHCHKYAGNASDEYNFQIILNQTTNTVQVVYGTNSTVTTLGPNTCADAATDGPGVGLANSTSDFNTRAVVNGTTTWATSTAGAVSTDVCQMQTSNVPASGLTWTWSPPPPSNMSYVSSTTAQLLNGVPALQNSTNNQIIQIQVVTSGSTNPLSVTSFSLGTNGSTAPATDISNAKIYYTGTSNVFATTTLVGTTNNPNGTFSLTGSQQLSSGTNYFWLTYDLQPAAVVPDLLDAQCNTITGSGSMGTVTPTIIAPAGNRFVDKYCVGQFSFAGSCCGLYMTNVTFGTINNNSGFDPNGNFPYAYTGNLGLSTNISQGATYPISITEGTSGNANGFSVWIDWNNDGSFTDNANKFFSLGVLTAGGTTTISGNISVPLTANLGPLRMRVRSNFSTAPLITDACTTLSYGETEDYMVNVTAATNMVYVSSTTLQLQSGVGVLQGSTNQQIIQEQVVMSGTLNPINLTSLLLNTVGSTNPGTDISNAKVYYTGTSNVFATTTQFGSTFNNPNGVYTVNGSQALQNGTNYFWITYDIKPSAIVGDVVDGACNQITGSGTMGTQVPTITSPAGNRPIIGPLCGTYSVGPTGNYTSITAAVADIALKGMSCAVILELQSTYLSSVETFPLSFSTIPTGTLTAANTLTIRPQTGASNLSITSANTIATIDLNGINVQYVTFDGRQGGTGTNRDLKLDCTYTAGPCVRFINSASNCALRYCTITGVNTSTSFANVYFATTTSVVQGNNNNTIDNCDLHDGATQPLQLIYSSGSTSPAVLNSGNSVTNCLLSNYFGTTTTNGIFLTSGNTAWTITGNRFYQTAPRTYTIGATHTAINISSTLGGAGGFTINNNIIGYASSSGTGVYTMLGAVASGFRGISLTQTITGTASNIQGNTITAFNLTTTSGTSTTTGIWCGISVTQGDCNIGNTSPNFIGDALTNGAVTTTTSTSLGLTVGINDNSTGNVNISNNTIGSFTVNGSTTAISPAFTAIGISTGIPTVNGNTIGSPSVSNSINMPTASTTASSGALFGINITAVTGVTSINNNSINNMNNAGTTTAHTNRAIVYSGTSAATVNNNTITNLTCGGSFAGVAGTACINGILVNGTALGGVTVSGNTINTLNCTNAGVFSTGVMAISVSNPGSLEVYKNKIWNLINASTQTLTTAPPCGIGIQFRANPDSCRIYNNFISLGNSQTTNTEFIGIMNNFNTIGVMKTFYNSVNIEGAVGAGALPTFCFYRGDFGVTNTINTPVIIYNNIFNNARSGGTGKHYAIGNAESSPTTNWVAGNVNNNCYNSPLATTIGLWFTTDQTLAQLQASSLCDNQSVANQTVSFVNSAAGNLHWNGVSPTPIAQGGIIYGTTTDIDGTTRPITGSFPDMGAHEFNGTFLDVIAPTITYTALGNGNVAATRSFTNVSASDRSGINSSSGTKPRVYYKKSGDNNDLTGWKFVEANGTTSPFDFTINYALLNAGSVNTGDIIQYFVVAQDLAATPNVAINSGTFASNPGSVNLQPANFPIGGTINQYTIQSNVYSGVYTVGTGGTFLSFTNAGGFFDALNSGSVSGNITLRVISDISTETGAITLNPISESGTGGYTVTVVSSTSTLRTISGNPGGTTALMKLSGTARVVFDGRIGGVGNYLTFANTNTTASTGGETFRISNDANNVTLEYINIQGNCQGFVGGVVNIAGTTGTLGNQNITIDHCNINNYTGSNPFDGITSWAQSQSLNNVNINITNNNIYDFGVNSAATNCMGVWFQWTSGSTVSGNSFYRTAGTLTGTNLNTFFIETPSGTGAGNTVTGNYMGGSAPLCGSTAFTTTTSSSFYCIDFIDVSLHTTATTVTNNVMKNISATSTTSPSGQIILLGVLNSSGAGAVSISGNTFGDNTVDASVSPSILFTNSSAGLTFAVEAFDSRSGNGAITNNNVGGIRSIRTSTGLTTMNLIFSATQGTKNITGNLIGSTNSDNPVSNKVSDEEIARLQKLPNYAPGEIPPVKSNKNTNPYMQSTKDGKVLVTGVPFEVAEQPADNVQPDMEQQMKEKQRIEQIRMSQHGMNNSNINNDNNQMNVPANKNTGYSVQDALKRDAVNKQNATSNINRDNAFVRNTTGTFNTNNNINGVPGNVQLIKSPVFNTDNVNATIANISQEAPSQLVGIFVSAVGGTISNNTIANIFINTGAVTAPVVNFINISNSSIPSTNDVVQNNTIRNITDEANVLFTLLDITSATTYPGTLTITGNTIGGVIALSPLTPTSNSLSMTCINSSGTGFHVITNNTLTGISTGSLLNGGTFVGITEALTSPATATITGNQIIGWTLNGSTVASTHVFEAIGASGTGNYNIDQNTISGIITNSNSTLSPTSISAFDGIYSTLTSSNNVNGTNTIRGNIITNINVSPFTPATTVYMVGIFQNSSTAVSQIINNFISGWTDNSTSISTTLYGWYSFFGAKTTFEGNIFDLGNGSTTDHNIYALYDFADEPQTLLYNNLIRVRGTLGSLGSDYTYCYYHTGSSSVFFTNNALINARSNTIGNDLCIYCPIGSTYLQGSNYNNLYSATNTVGYYNATYDNFAAWKTETNKDAQSCSLLPSFDVNSRVNSTDDTMMGRGTFIGTLPWPTDLDGNTWPTSQSTTLQPPNMGASQIAATGSAGNQCALSGSIYQDGGKNAVEIVGGTFTVTNVFEFTGKRTTHTAVNNPWIYWQLPGFAPTSEPVTLRFYYNAEQLATITESTLRVTYWNGSGWDNSFTPQSVNTSLHYVQVQFPTGFGWQSTPEFALESTNSPLPVTLSSFTASAVNRDVNVNWVTESEMNNHGFYVERRTKVNANTFSEWQSLGFIQGMGNSNTQHAYSYSDKKLNAGDYQYRLKQVDNNGNVEYHTPSNNADVIIGKPMSSEISQNYPNPANPKTKIDYQIPFDGKVSIKVYDLTGREVVTLVDKTQQAGYYTTEFDGTNLASGVYFYRIVADGNGDKFTKTLKMVIVK